MKSKINFLILGLAITVILSGCTLSQSGSKSSKTYDGGIWRSTDSGKLWSQIVAVPTATGKTATIANVDVRKIIFDPSDSSAIYLTTENNGIIYSYDGGNSWMQFKKINTGKIYSLAIDPKDKCNLYVVGENKLFKSTDCGRSWVMTYFHQKDNVLMTDVIIDSFNSQVVYMADSIGEIFKSTNGGQTWNTIFREPNSNLFAELVMSPKDSRIIYAATWQKGIYKTVNGGQSWESLGEGLSSYSNSSEYKKLIIDKSSPDNLILASKFGILRSKDAGKSWEIVPILQATGQTNIYAIVVNPKNIKEIYYTTENTLVKSVDGGNSWSSSKLPFARLANVMAINYDNPTILYIGTKNPQN
ncbi:MAG: YCF48-related protein [Candidatus Buchananbacteria bacterium]